METVESILGRQLSAPEVQKISDAVKEEVERELSYKSYLEGK